MILKLLIILEMFCVLISHTFIGWLRFEKAIGQKIKVQGL